MSNGSREPAPAPRPQPEIFHGVSLEQYAGVTTALADGFALEAILANDRIAVDAWPRAELAWKVRLAKDGTGGPVFAEFGAKRAIAEDTLARGVAPIDADLAAWMGFLRAYAAHPAPFEMLKGAGLGMNDLSRLQRRWARRMAEDRALEREAADLVKKGAGSRPPIRVDAGVLKLFPWSPGPAPKPAPVVPKVEAPAETSFAPGQMRLYNYVAVKAQLTEHPEDEGRVIEELGLVDWAKTDAGWQEVLRSNPELERDYRRLFDARRAKIRALAKRGPAAPALASPAPVPAAPAPTGVARPPARLAGTALALDVPRKAALPFAESTPGAPPPGPPAPPSPPGEASRPSPRASFAATSLAVEVPRRAALPFPAAAPAPQPAPTQTPSAGLPPLTLEQHASLCFEIAEAPAHALETLARYQVTLAVKQAADQHHAERFAREPGAREAWDRAYQTYRAWWLASRVNR